MSEQMPDRMPEWMSDRMSEYIVRYILPDSMSETICQTKKKSVFEWGSLENKSLFFCSRRKSLQPRPRLWLWSWTQRQVKPCRLLVDGWWFNTHRIHGAGIFNYITGRFCGKMLVNIPAPWFAVMGYDENMLDRRLIVSHELGWKDGIRTPPPTWRWICLQFHRIVYKFYKLCFVSP